MARPREFNQDQVIEKAMMLFWEQGYESTSVRDLKQAMGISTSSMYEAFGDKRGVYLAALSRFCQIEQERIAILAQDVVKPQLLIEELFGSVEQAADTAVAGGTSMAYNAMIEFGTRDVEVTQVLMTHYFALAEIIAAVIQQAQQDQIMGNTIKSDVLAHTILATLQGLATVKSAHPQFTYGGGIARVLMNLCM